MAAWNARYSIPPEPLFHDVPRETIVWMSHGDRDHRVGPDFRPAGCNPELPRRRGAPPQAADLWSPVSSRGLAHAVWLVDPRQFSGPDLFQPSDLDYGGVHRTFCDRDRPARRPERPGGLRAVRRCRFGRPVALLAKRCLVPGSSASSLTPVCSGWASGARSPRPRCPPRAELRSWMPRPNSLMP